MDLVKKMDAMGADSICIKDMAGILMPDMAFNLVTELKKITKKEAIEIARIVLLLNLPSVCSPLPPFRRKGSFFGLYIFFIKEIT